MYQVQCDMVLTNKFKHWIVLTVFLYIVQSDMFAVRERHSTRSRGGGEHNYKTLCEFKGILSFQSMYSTFLGHYVREGLQINFNRNRTFRRVKVKLTLEIRTQTG